MNSFDIDVERAVIGAIIAYEDLAASVLIIEPQDFYYKEHQRIYERVKRLYLKKGKLDFVSLAAESDPDDKAEITQCVQTVISMALFEEHLSLFQEMANRRRLVDGFNQLMYEGECSVANLQKLLDDESTRHLTAGSEEKTRENLERFKMGLNENKQPLLTGFATLDKISGGLRKGTVFILGARPSTGKTAFAINVAANQVRLGKKVMFFSLEMSAEMIFERYMASEHGICYESFSRNKLTDVQIERIRTEADKLKADGNLIVTDDLYNIELICNQIMEVKPQLAVVDFMQIISSTQRFENVRTRIDYISSELKKVAKRTGCTVMILSQLSRNGADAPRMSDLKESGGLEQDGDYIALLHRPYVLNKKENADFTPEQTEMLLDKNKFGRTGIINLYFDLTHQQFHETDTRWDNSVNCVEDPF